MRIKPEIQAVDPSGAACLAPPPKREEAAHKATSFRRLLVRVTRQLPLLRTPNQGYPAPQPVPQLGRSLAPHASHSLRYIKRGRTTVGGNFEVRQAESRIDRPVAIGHRAVLGNFQMDSGADCQSLLLVEPCARSGFSKGRENSPAVAVDDRSFLSGVGHLPRLQEACQLVRDPLSRQQSCFANF